MKWHKSYIEKCEANKDGTYDLTVTVGDQNITCASEGTQSVNGKFSIWWILVIIFSQGYQGLLNCPDPTTFCSTKALQFCRRGCMGRGTCVKGQCVCRDGFNGTSCQYRVKNFS